MCFNVFQSSCFVLDFGWKLYNLQQSDVSLSVFLSCDMRGQLCVIAVHVFVSQERKNNYCLENTKSTITHWIHAMSLLFVSFAVDKKTRQDKREKVEKHYNAHLNWKPNTRNLFMASIFKNETEFTPNPLQWQI